MKSKILFIVISVLFVGCSTPKKKLINDAQSFLKSTLNDPKSYQPESIVIYDTMTVLEFTKNKTNIDLESSDFNIKIKNMDIKSDKDEIELYLLLKSDTKPYRENLKKHIWELDSLRNRKDKLIQRTDSINAVTSDKSPIKFIYLLATYRAKNSFNAVIKTETKILYWYKEMQFEVLPD
jgi:hypothetical protein